MESVPPPRNGPHIAMVLAAGLGTRMRPLTATRPKPLIEVGGKPLIDHMLGALAAAGVQRAIVNVHYLPEQIEAHLRTRSGPEIIISDERACLLETGGALARVQYILGPEPIFVGNTDQIWVEPAASPPGGTAGLLAAAFDPDRMDVLLLLARREASLGYHGRGDFFRTASGRLLRRGDASEAPFVFAGLYVIRPQIFAGYRVVPFSANVLFNIAAGRGRLYGHVMDPFWMHVGDPEARAAAESRWQEEQKWRGADSPI